MQFFDAIVVGVGGMGSAALYHLAKRGLHAVGLEQFDIAHDRGSSHGRTRIIRKAYFEHGDYIPLLHRTYDGWAELENATARTLVERVGLILVGPSDGRIIPNVKTASDRYGLDIESLTSDEAAGRFTGFRFGPEDEVLFEPDGGFLHVEDCVRAHADAAVAHGATVLTGQIARSIVAERTHVTVRTDADSFTASHVVVTAGPWSGSLLADLGLPLEVRRKTVLWFAPRTDVYDRDRGCPVFGFETSGGFFYGFPVLDSRGVKVAEHTGGQVVPMSDQVDRSLLPEDEPRVREFVAAHLPDLSGERTDYSVCLYTMTPDENFIIDRHPDHARVLFAAGFSGHGFKFAPVVGSILADLLIDGGTAEPIDFLRLARPGLNP